MHVSPNWILEFMNFHGKLVSFRPFTHVSTEWNKQKLGWTDDGGQYNFTQGEKNKGEKYLYTITNYCKCK